MLYLWVWISDVLSDGSMDAPCMRVLIGRFDWEGGSTFASAHLRPRGGMSSVFYLLLCARFTWVVVGCMWSAVLQNSDFITEWTAIVEDIHPWLFFAGVQTGDLFLHLQCELHCSFAPCSLVLILISRTCFMHNSKTNYSESKACFLRSMVHCKRDAIQRCPEIGDDIKMACVSVSGCLPRF